MSAVRKYLERKYSRTPDVDSEMTDGDSSELTFHEVGSAENDGQLRSPKAIPVENMILEDFFVDIAHTAKNKGSPKSIPMESMILDDFLVDIAHTAKINKVKPNDSDKDMSGSSISALTQDCNIKGLVPQAFIEAESNVLYQVKPSLKKPVAQANVSFQKGYSQMDWLKLRHTQPDLSGLEGQSRSISLKEVKQHKSGESIWIILKGGVYNVAPYMKFHPGGVDMLMKTAGKDCTALFNQYHPWVNAKFLLEKCYIGSLAPHECMYTIKDTMAPNLEARHSSPTLASPLPWRLGGTHRRHNQGGCPSGRRRRPVRRAIQS